MMELLDMMETTTTDKMSNDELRIRLLSYFRGGKLTMDLKGPVLGFAAAVSRGKVSPRQLELARKLVQECRYMDGTEPIDLIDGGDVEAVEDVWAEFK